MSLFRGIEAENLKEARPLAARMRPRGLEEFVGQAHLVGEGMLLRRLLAAGRLGSLIFHGPPGTGKTTLARLLAGHTGSTFRALSAVDSRVQDLREELQAARSRLAADRTRTLLFVDEIHRFNKAQQDALLGDVEEGIVTLVGATSENPHFAVIGPLVSRSHLFRFEPLTPAEVRTLLERALGDAARGFGRLAVTADPEALDFLAAVCDGDARRALAALEIAVLSAPRGEPPAGAIHLTEPLAREAVQRKAISYDRRGDRHYDAASALIKSVRGSDPDAALYWLARMLEAGEEVRFLARRLVILASEDVGNADPAALTLAVSAMQACEFVGLPECQLTLAQAVTYLACAPKSNAVTTGIAEARRDVVEQRLLPVPVHLRDPRSAGADRAGKGETYRYAHEDPEGIVAQDYLGVERTYYRPVDRGFERELAARLEKIRARIRAARPPLDT